MSYIDGFVIAVPTANKQQFIEHAKVGDSVFIDLGATRVIAWPDKETRDAASAKMTGWMNNPAEADPRMNLERNPMPFDGKRLIYGGFEPLVELAGGPQGKEA